MKEQIEEMIEALSIQLLEQQSPSGLWRGELSPSAVSTSVSVFALHLIDSKLFEKEIHAGARWLKSTMLEDGSWGDSEESPSNLTATLLSYAALYAVDSAPQKTNAYLVEKFGGITDQEIIDGVLSYYGKDLTFSAPILVMCALAGVIKSWKNIPQLPFELAILPQRFFKFLQLPVVSYAIPALIAVGILRHKKARKGPIYAFRELFTKKSMKVLEHLQPKNGGFLEAAPLSAFVAMCLCGAGYIEHPVTQRVAHFLANTVRTNGSWPIDTDLASWVTTLSIKALNTDLKDKKRLSRILKSNAFTAKHPFTGARKGGWGWSDLPGAAPDADDTAGNLIALHHLLDGKYCPEIGHGIEWLLDLQNSDGGIPTFCKGWGKLPFDRSSPDITAHAFTAIELWQDVLPLNLQKACIKSKGRMIRWMQRTLERDGSWTPLWFGDQDALNERAPVYGTAAAVEHLGLSKDSTAQQISNKGIEYLLSTQNEDGGWGGAIGLPSKITFTARTLSALASTKNQKVLEKGVDYLYQRYKTKTFDQPEPIGLYFARLWYSEKLYPICFSLLALKNISKALKLGA